MFRLNPILTGVLSQWSVRWAALARNRDWGPHDGMIYHGARAEVMSSFQTGTDEEDIFSRGGWRGLKTCPHHTMLQGVRGLEGEISEPMTHPSALVSADALIPACDLAHCSTRQTHTQGYASLITA